MGLGSIQAPIRTRRRNRLAHVQALFARRRSRQDAVFIRYPPWQSPREERANALTHGAAAVASLAGAVWLIAAAVRSGDALTVAGCSVYAAALMAVFAMSTLSHLALAPRLRQLFRTLDQACIYLLIAGTSTPFVVKFLLPYGWTWMLPALWLIALFGAWSKLRGDGVNSVSIASHVALGWLPMVGIRTLLTAMPAACLALIVAGGALYMLGTVFLVCDDRRAYFHAAWHVFVIAASACFYAGIALFVV